MFGNGARIGMTTSIIKRVPVKIRLDLKLAPAGLFAAAPGAMARNFALRPSVTTTTPRSESTSWASALRGLNAFYFTALKFSVFSFLFFLFLLFFRFPPRGERGAKPDASRGAAGCKAFNASFVGT